MAYLRSFLYSHTHSLTAQPKTAPVYPWNPLNWLRFLWWIFVVPERYAAYEQDRGKPAARKVGAWLSGTLAWLPLFIPMLGLSLGTFPPENKPLGIPFGVWGIVILLAWFLTIRLDLQDRDSDLAIGLAFVIAGAAVGVMAAGIASGIEELAVVIAGVVLAGIMAFGVASIVSLPLSEVVSGVVVGGTLGGVVASVDGGVVFFVANIGMAGLAIVVVRTLKRNLLRLHSSRLSRICLIVLALAYAALIWMSLLGGYRLFGVA